MAFSKYKDFKRPYEILSKSAKEGKIANAYIIEGDMITGKKDFALQFIKAFLCKEQPGEGCENCIICRKIDHGNYEDLNFITKGDKKSIGVDVIRDISERLLTKPVAEGGRTVIIIEEGDSMTVQAQNVLLKTLEEPPEGAVIIILSENTENLIQTVRSRCITIRLYRTENSLRTDAARIAAENASKATELAKTGRFRQVTDFLKPIIKNEEDAAIFLDGMEVLMADCMLTNRSDFLTREDAKRAVILIEDARREMKQGGGYRYAVKDLMLKMRL